MAWTAAAAGLFVLFLRISLTQTVSSDAANNALQSWDMLHGQPMLHGWILGDATYYAFDLPVILLTEIFLGLHTITMHVAVTLIYLIVAVLAVTLAVGGSRGSARAVRAAVVVAVLSAPLLITSDRWITLGFPDHTGTTVFLLAACLLIDRAPAWRFTAPLLCVLLCAGQISDATVRFVAIPAIGVVCAYRALAARKLVTRDSVNLIATLVAVPLSLAVRAIMRHYGAYVMISPQTRLASVSQWGHNWAQTWDSLRYLFGAQGASAQLPGSTVIFGYACMIVAAAGIVRVLWRWRTARIAEQVLLVAIVANIGVYAFSTLPTPDTPHDIVLVLPAGAILGARALVPVRIRARLWLQAATVTIVAAIVLVPASLVATQRPNVPGWTSLSAWLREHNLTYGLAGYWRGSAITLLSGNQVRVRAVKLAAGLVTLYPWETNTLWYSPSRHYADFVIVATDSNDLSPRAERIFGRPASTHRVGPWDVLVYDKNLLKQLSPPTLRPTS